MKAFIRIFALLSVLCMFFSCTNPVAPIDTKITSFVFKQADNPTLPSDVAGKIDYDTKVISVLMPSTVAFADYSALVPTIGLPEGVQCENAHSARDFRVNPLTYTITSSDGAVEVYGVKVTKGAVTAPATALVISEYYCGTGYALSGDRNRWLELTNRTASAIDLSQYSLKQNVWVNGTRTEARDTIAALSGTLPANASYVIYSERLNARFTSVVAAANKTSDTTLNTIMDFDGDDGFQLIQNGVVVDVVGPDSGNGDGSVFAREKRLLRKNTSVPNTVYNDAEWVAYVLDKTNLDAANTGSATATFAGTDTTLTYFAFEGISPRAYGIINNTNHTVQIAVPEGTSVSALAPSFSTQGLGVTINGSLVKSGIDKVDFTSPVSIVAWGSNGTAYQEYIVAVSSYSKMQFTSTNYTFSGGIKAVVDTLKSGVDAATVGTLKSFSSTVINGVITGKGIAYKFGSITNKNCFTIQDKDEAVMIWSSDGTDLPLGSRISVVVNQGQYCYAMQLITNFGSISLYDPLIYNIYYQEGPYKLNSATARVFKWTGTVSTSPDGYNEGKFDAAGNYMYQTNTALSSYVQAGKTGSFYGPIMVNYSKYKMQITDPEQVK